LTRETRVKGWQPIRWEELPNLLRSRFEEIAAVDQGVSIAAVLSPMMSCEEAWLLAKFIRAIAPRAALVLGYVPIEGEDQTFPKGFAIKAEKCPNRRGVEETIKHFGGKTMTFEEFVTAAGDGMFKAAYVAGGYPKPWITDSHARPLARVEFLVVHDLFPSLLDETATVQIPSASFAEREGSFMNCDGLLQPFERAIPPLEGVKADGQFVYELAGESGLFRAPRVREAAGAELPALQKLHVPPDEPEHGH